MNQQGVKLKSCRPIHCDEALLTLLRRSQGGATSSGKVPLPSAGILKRCSYRNKHNFAEKRDRDSLKETYFYIQPAYCMTHNSTDQSASEADSRSAS